MPYLSFLVLLFTSFVPDSSLEKVSGYPGENRREARKLGLLRSKSSEAERERMKPQERNERVFEG